MDTNLSKFWRDWKNVIIITVLVIINITSLTWAPVVASWFKSDPTEIESFSKNIQDTLWLIVFVFAAQIIFSNRRKRIDEKNENGCNCNLCSDNSLIVCSSHMLLAY